MVGFISVNAKKYTYSFHNTPISQALVVLSQDNPDINIAFIYKELDNYKTSSKIDTDDLTSALRQIIDLHPITLFEKNGIYYVEALQHGRHTYSGHVIGTDNEPVVAATIMLLAPNDSTVMTFGIADEYGRFQIPCDFSNVLAKLSCIGYDTKYLRCNSFNLGTITMTEKSVKLNEVKVQAENASLSSDRSVFIPNGRQKNSAQDAVDLLQQMTIPLIRINPITKAVTDNAGVGVALYINSLEATTKDLKGMRMSDVLRVEYLEFPTDPRYKGAPRVINFVLREYDYGGYTKLNLEEKLLAGVSNNSSVFTRVNFKEMTYDLFVGADNEDNHHCGKSSEGTYKLTSADGIPLTLTRTEICDNSHYRSNEYPVTFRATYNAEKAQIRNQIGFTNSSVPVNEYHGRLNINDDTEEERLIHKNPNHSNSLSYSGSYFFVLPKDFSLHFSPRLNYSHLFDKTMYIMGSDELQRSAKENAVDYRADLFIRRKLGQKNSLIFGINHGGNINRVNYKGAEKERDHFTMTFSSVQMGYQYNSNKISLYADAGYAWETNKINANYKTDSYPYTHINIIFTPTQKHQFSAYIQLASTTPLLSMKTSNIVQENEVYFISGNPQLKASRLTTFNLAYTWIPTNNFGASVYGFCESQYNRMIAVYEPFLDGTAVKRSYINNGDLYIGEIGLPLTGKLFNDKLQLYLAPQLSIYKSTGQYKDSFTHLLFLLQATYYVKDFYIQALWESPKKILAEENPSIREDRNFHSLILGWSNARWNLRIRVNNIFNKGWKDNIVTTTSPYYSERQISYSTSYHPAAIISVTYNFGFGTKITKDNEAGGQSGASSAILK